MKFAAYVPELVMSQIELIYFFNTNLAFRQYASKLATAIRIFSHIKVLQLVSCSGYESRRCRLVPGEINVNKCS